MKTNDSGQISVIKKWNKKNAMEHWKYCDDYNQTFTKESNFGFK